MPLLMFSVSIQAQMSPGNNRVQEIKDFSQTISGDIKTTYIELIREIFPGAKIEGEKFRAGDSISLRSLNSQSEPRTFKRGKLIEKVLQTRFSSENKNHLALFFKLRNEAAVRSLNNNFFVLAAFRLKNRQIELVEAIDAQFIFNHQNINFQSEMPLLPLRKGEDGIWMVASRENSSGDTVQDFRLVGLQNKKFEVLLDELPTLKGSSGCGFRIEQSLAVFPKKDNPANYRTNYRNFSLTVTENLRTNTLKCEVKPPSDYEKTFAYKAVWDDYQKRYKIVILKTESVAVAPTKYSADLSEPLEFAGKMEVGKIYKAAIGCRGNPEWQLKINPQAPDNARALVFWSASGLRLPRAKLLTEEQCNANILFKVLKEKWEMIDGKFRTIYECEIRVINGRKF